VTAGYGKRRVVEDVSLEAEPGRITGLIGPNGAGKTTLVRVATRGLRPMLGRVTVGGVDPYDVSAKRAAQLVAVVPQDLTPAFSYSVLEMVLMGRSPHQGPFGGRSGEDWTKVRWALTAANVQHVADRPIEELSGGERQRVVLAQALAQDAPVLLLDEPTTHLDLRHVVDMLALVRRLARTEGTAVLAIFHDLNLAAATCDRIYALAEGRVVAAGDPSSVITRTLVREVFGVEADVEPSTATGRPAVVLTPAVGDGGTTRGRAHVIGGAGRGAGAMRAMAELGYEVSAGVLNEGDTDAAVAERLGMLRIIVPPFSAIDERSVADCLAVIHHASLLVVSDAPFGPANLRNLRMALEARRPGLDVVLIEQIPIEERDFTGGQATALWRELRRTARSAGSTEALVALARTLEGTDAGR
jgi:iron complex transport system ATP-binding protein